MVAKVALSKTLLEVSCLDFISSNDDIGCMLTIILNDGSIIFKIIPPGHFLVTTKVQCSL